MFTIEAHALRKSYGRQQALDGLDLTATPGVVGLLGPNGAGKTTLLRAIATVLPVDSGELRILGRDPRKEDECRAVRRRLGYLPQAVSFHRGFTAFEALDYVAVLKEHDAVRARHDEVRRVLELVGLTDVAGRKVRALSGGMKQRLGLAQALLGRPELLVLDEPTVGLDPEQRMRFRDLVSQIGAGRTVVLSTHQTEDVAALCNRIVVVHAGRSLFAGTPHELVEIARGRVWVDETSDPRAVSSWRRGDGSYRLVGEPPPGAQLVEPAIEDAYLLLQVTGGRVGTQA